MVKPGTEPVGTLQSKKLSTNVLTNTPPYVDFVVIVMVIVNVAVVFGLYKQFTLNLYGIDVSK